MSGRDKIFEKTRCILKTSTVGMPAGRQVRNRNKELLYQRDQKVDIILKIKIKNV
jgi:hypothetical protein